MLRIENGMFTKEKHFDQSHSNWSTIPIEILSKIFHYLLCVPKGVSYLSRCTQVCNHWCEVGSQPLSWQGNVDLSFMCNYQSANDFLLERLCSTRLNEIRGIDLSGWTLISKSGIESIATHCWKLEHFRLSSTNIVDTDIFPLFDIRGLKYLDLSQNFNITTDIFHGICKHDNTSLEVLNLSSTSLRVICFISLQKSCPNLKELYLDNLEFNYNYHNMYNDETLYQVSFPKLEVLSIAKATTDFSSHSDILLQCLLHASCNLKTLDLNGNRAISHAALWFPSVRIERLFLARTSISLETIKVICERWSKTIIEIDLSWTFSPNFDDLITYMMSTTDKPCTNLKYINLSGNMITDSSVLLILEKCCNLEWLDLTLCHKVTSRCRRSHDGVESIQNLIRHYKISHPGAKPTQ